MARRTKIIATIGPASDSEAMIKDLAEAGMDVARIGLAHGSLDEAIEKFRRVRRVEASLARPIGVMIDLPGPKVRAGTMPEQGLPVDQGDVIHLTPGNQESTAKMIHVDHEGLLTDLHVGDRVAFGDGVVMAEVLDRKPDCLEARITHGGLLQGRPGVHIPSDRLRIASPTPEDLHMLDAFIEEGIDMVAISFVRSAHDVRRVGVEPHPRGPLVVAKIETRAAVDNLDSIIEASGAVMIARGDLGAEMPIEELPHLQKRIIQRCITLGRPAITATQMLESMVTAPTPTRAEASDIANAVFDGSSAVMLSGESAIGHDPINAVATMARIAARADDEFDYDAWGARVHEIASTMQPHVDDTVTLGMTNAAWRAALETNASAIICITHTGFTVRSIARFRPEAKILGFSTDPQTLRQLTLSWGATPQHLDVDYQADNVITRAVDQARENGVIRRGDLVAVLSGSREYPGQATDSLRLIPIR
ncbi:pyruvate kinase [Aquihabitans daechungensis]|uniref:pyruvate kinase n=1 Tax=Aquihabitans daechungensis TaxID=1052257 RepID=UPI003BA1E1B3